MKKTILILATAIAGLALAASCTTRPAPTVPVQQQAPMHGGGGYIMNAK